MFRVFKHLRDCFDAESRSQQEYPQIVNYVNSSNHVKNDIIHSVNSENVHDSRENIHVLTKESDDIQFTSTCRS